MIGSMTARFTTTAVGHAPSTDFPLDGIAVGEGGLETVEKVRHCVLAPLATL